MSLLAQCIRLTTVFLPQALDAAMKQYKSLSPETSAMFFSVDQEAGKILCMSCVPKVGIHDKTGHILDRNAADRLGWQGWLTLYLFLSISNIVN